MIDAVKQAANRVADFTDSPWFKVLSVGIMPCVFAIVVPVVWWVGNSIEDHGQALVKMSVTLDDLRGGQTRIERSIGDNADRITEVVKEAQMQARDIAKLQQELEDRRTR